MERTLLAKSTGTGDPQRKEMGWSSECGRVTGRPHSPHHLEAQGQEIENKSICILFNYKQMDEIYNFWGSLIQVRPKASIKRPHQNLNKT